MKRFISLAAFILLVSLPVVSQKMTIFGGVPFNGNLEQFVTKMVEKGFEYIDDEGHDAFVGKYLGDDVEVFMMGNTNTGQLIGVTAMETFSFAVSVSGSVSFSATFSELRMLLFTLC